jgi:hypothetical protein
MTMPGKPLQKWFLALVIGATALASCFSAPAGDDLATRREQIERLQPAEQQELLRKQERFAGLPAYEQERLRALQAALDADPKAEQLRQVLSRYHEWLKTLTPTQRAELADLPPAERVEQIKRIQKQQRIAREQAHRVEVLSSKDMRVILKWTEDLAWKRRERLLAGMSDAQRKYFDSNDEKHKRRILLYKALWYERARRGSKGSGSLLGVEEADIERLSAELSEPARHELTEAGSLAAQRRIAFAWMGTALHRLDPSHAGRKLGPLAGEDLAQFLQNDVPLPQRERLLKMPREQMLEELRAMYHQRGRGDSRLPGGANKPWLNRLPSDRPPGEFRGKGGNPPATEPVESQSETSGKETTKN